MKAHYGKPFNPYVSKKTASKKTATKKTTAKKSAKKTKPAKPSKPATKTTTTKAKKSVIQKTGIKKPTINNRLLGGIVGESIYSRQKKQAARIKKMFK